MVEHRMRGAVARRESVVGEAGQLQVASLEHDDRPSELVEVDTHCEQVVEPAERTHVIQLIPRHVDVAQVHERAQHIDARQTAAQEHRVM